MTECQPFAQDDIVNFFLEVNEEFEFGLEGPIENLRVLEKNSIELENIFPLHQFLENSSISNLDKINKLY